MNERKGNEPRRPAAFRIEEDTRPDQPEAAPRPKDQPRRHGAETGAETKEAPREPAGGRTPLAMRLAPDGEDDHPHYTEAQTDPFADELDALPAATPPARRRRGIGLAGLFFSALGALISLGMGIWIDGLIADLFARADWLGWVAIGLTALLVTSLFALMGRELLALSRLSSVATLQRRATRAIAEPKTDEVRKLSADLSQFLSGKPETKAGRAELARHSDEIIDAPDLLSLTETELFTTLDRKAVAMIMEAAQRTSLVTAVSPRALVDIAYVVFEAGRLIRRLAELYGGRPGTLGFIRLARDVFAHLAVTGSIAAGDSLIQQVIGHGLAARLSARLGEGVINGLMTVRIGIAAMEVVRPMPFHTLKRPAMSAFLSELTRFVRKENEKTEERRP